MKSFLETNLVPFLTSPDFAICAATLFPVFRCRSVPVNKFIVKTGLFIEDVSVSRSTIQWPFQKIKVISMEPINFRFLKSSRSKELIPFSLPLTLTVAPVHPHKNSEGFLNFVTRLGDMDQEKLSEILENIVDEEIQSFIGNKTFFEITNDINLFRRHFIHRVSGNLNSLGLEVYNANIGKLRKIKESNWNQEDFISPFSETENNIQQKNTPQFPLERFNSTSKDLRDSFHRFDSPDTFYLSEAINRNKE